MLRLGALAWVGQPKEPARSKSAKSTVELSVGFRQNLNQAANGTLDGKVYNWIVLGLWIVLGIVF